MKDHCTGTNIKQKVRNITNKYRYFLKSNFEDVNKLFVLVYSNQDDNAEKYKTRSYYLPKGIIKNYNVIISGKNVFDQTIDSNIKRYKEIRKLTTRQDKDYTT